MRIRTEKVRTFDLGHEQVLVFERGRVGRVRVLQGAAWLTAEGEPADTILRPGSEVMLRDGRTLIEGLGTTRIQVIERAACEATPWTLWLRRLRRTAHRHIARLQFGQTAAQTLV